MGLGTTFFRSLPDKKRFYHYRHGYLYLTSTSEGEMQLSGGEFSSFFSFLMEPLTDLEPGSSSCPESSNIEGQNAQEDVGK